MTGLVRANVDTHEGHDGDNRRQTPFHKTYYKGGSPNVSVNNEPAIRKGDSTLCGDVAVGGSATVFINNQPAHCSGDRTSGHGGWRPNTAKTGSPDVSAG